MESFINFINENTSPRIKVIKARVRTINGKLTVQRRKKVSNVKGYTLRGGTLKRISPLERLHRKLGARRAKVKRKAKAGRIALKRKITMRRRHSLGLR